MKKILPIICLLLAACGGRPKTTEAVETWPITPKNELTEKLLVLDSISRSIMDGHDMAALASEIALDLDMQEIDVEDRHRQRDSAEQVWHRFIVLCNEEKNCEALELYRENKPLFALMPEHSTARFYLHCFVGIMAQDCLPEEEMRAGLIDDLEMDLMMAEGIMLFSNGETVPEHYERLLQILSSLYCEEERWDKVLELNDKFMDLYEDDELAKVAISLDKAGFLASMDDKAGARKLLRESKATLEELLKAEEDEYQVMDLQDMIKDIDNRINALK